jgi:hypothetical protein
MKTIIHKSTTDAIMKLSKHFARTAVAAAGAIATLLAAPAALAVPIGTVYSFALDAAQQSAGLPGSSYGMVTLTQGLDKVDVNVTLANGFLFANTGIGAQFAFNLTQPFVNAAITLDAATAANFVAGTPGRYNVTPYGIFSEALLFKSGTRNGMAANIGTPLNFSVAQTGISLDAFATSGARNNGQRGGYSFAADVGYALTGKTGGVGGIDHETTEAPPAPADSTELPEPLSLTLLGLGLGGIALARRRK